MRTCSVQPHLSHRVAPANDALLHAEFGRLDPRYFTPVHCDMSALPNEAKQFPVYCPVLETIAFVDNKTCLPLVAVQLCDGASSNASTLTQRVVGVGRLPGADPANNEFCAVQRRACRIVDCCGYESANEGQIHVSGPSRQESFGSPRTLTV